MRRFFNPADFKLIRTPTPRYSNKMPEHAARDRGEGQVIHEAQLIYSSRFGASLGSGCFHTIASIDRLTWN